MVIWRIAADTDPDVLTIRQLKNGIRANLLNEDLRRQFDGELRRLEFTKGLAGIEEKVRELRCNYIAHFNRSWNVNPDSEVAQEREIRLSDLREASTLLNSLLNLLCFGHGRGVLPIQYDPGVRHAAGTDARPDIVRVLDSVAKDSALLNMSEREPDYWRVYRQQLSEHDLGQLNDYRRRFGLEEG